MARPPSPPVDPATDAAGLLRRAGFVLLMLVLPPAALLSRRATVILAPIGVALLVVAAFLDGNGRRVSRDGDGWHPGPGVAAATVALGWCALSLVWTPYLGPAADRLGSIALTLLMAVAGYAAMPERMRSANLYLMAVGTGIAALGALASVLLQGRGIRLPDEEGQTLERGIIVLVMAVWPAIAWLRSRGRDLEALALAAAAALAAFVAGSAVPFGAFTLGALAFAVTAVHPERGVRAVAITLAALIALAPLVPLILAPIVGFLLPGSDFAEALRAWRSVILSEPIRLVTGHGFETALRGRLVGVTPPQTPSTILFEVWYELGLVGALASATALYYAVRSAGRSHAVVVPGMMAAFTAAFAFACMGIGTAQIWWFTTLAVIVLIFVATERGQFRTTRPKAILARLSRGADRA